MRRGFPRLVFIGATIGLGLMFLADVAFAYELLGGKWANVNDLPGAGLAAAIQH